MNQARRKESRQDLKARSMESQGDPEGGKGLVPSFHTSLPISIWARLYPHGSRLAQPDGFGAKAFHGEARPRLVGIGTKKAFERGSESPGGRALLGGGWSPHPPLGPSPSSPPGRAEPEREGKPERGCSSLCPHEGARAPSGPRGSSEALSGGRGKAPKAQAPRRGRMEA